MPDHSSTEYHWTGWSAIAYPGCSCPPQSVSHHHPIPLTAPNAHPLDDEYDSHNSHSPHPPHHLPQNYTPWPPHPPTALAPPAHPPCAHHAMSPCHRATNWSPVAYRCNHHSPNPPHSPHTSPHLRQPIHHWPRSPCGPLSR